MFKTGKFDKEKFNGWVYAVSNDGRRARRGSRAALPGRRAAARKPKIYLALGKPTCLLACGCLCWMSKLTEDIGRMVCDPAFCRVHFENMANILDATFLYRPSLENEGMIVANWYCRIGFGTLRG